MQTKGRVHKYGDNIDTDVIIPARYLNIENKKELASHAMEDIDENFVKNVKIGDIIVAGSNFGCGSSREHAPLVLKENGISVIIAKSFARIFYRNSINIGLAILQIEEVDRIEPQDELEIDFDSGDVKNKTKDEIYKSQSFPDFIKDIMKSGGLLNSIKQKGKK